jgi:hypothetical protein
MNNYIQELCYLLFDKNITNQNDICLIINFEIFDKFGIDNDNNICLQYIQQCRSSYQQHKFRINIISKYKKCILCDNDEALDACHILPYSVSNNQNILVKV